MAKVAITYNTNSYKIDYVDSENMKYNGTSIHKKYNSWVHNLENEIDKNLNKIKNGETIIYKKNLVNNVLKDLNSTVVTSKDDNISNSGFTCTNTFNFTGSLWKGRVVTAKQSVSNISKKQAVVQAASVLSTEGFIVDTTSPDVGLISAHEAKSNGKILPINLMFSEDDKSGVLAKLTISIPAGVSFNVGGMKSYMCNNVMSKIKSTGYIKKDIVNNVSNNNIKYAPKKDVATRLKELKKLYKNKLINKKDYESKKIKILDSL